MSDLPARLDITEEGPREGFQIEPGPIQTADKIRLIDALSETGVRTIQACSFVSPQLVPGWADADDVVQGITSRDGVQYTALWFNQRGISRAIAHKNKLTLVGTIHTVASELFCHSNLNRSLAENAIAMRKQTAEHLNAGIEVKKLSVMAAFGCNFAGVVTVEDTVNAVQQGMDIAQDADVSIEEIALADTMGWANPSSIERMVSSVRTRWPDPRIRLHLHDTRGLGIANAYAGLMCGVSRFDSTVGGLGGCPFAAKRSHGNSRSNSDLPPGNIATEELVLLAHELGIDTGIDLDKLIDVGLQAESIVAHRLPSAALRGGSLSRYRNLHV